MASHKVFLCWFVIFGVVGLGLHLAGFVCPSWIVMRTHKERIQIIIEEMTMTQGMEDAGLLLPGTAGRGMMPPPPPPEGHMSGPDGPMMMEPEHEHMQMVEIVRVMVAETDDFEMSMHYGLWFSKMCFHEKISKEEVIEEDEATLIVNKRDASSSSSEEEGRHGHHGKHGKKCHCHKLSTRCALKMAMFFESPMTNRQDRLSEHNMGHASLREHQIETSIGLVLFALGVIGGIASFRKPGGCRCVKGLVTVFLLVAITLIVVPVVRLAHYTHFRYSIHDGVDIRVPISAVLSSSACSLGLLAAIVAFVGMLAQGRKEKSGRWYQFNNELETEKSGKGPALEFYNDAYPVKAGLVEVCDFSDIKPQEEMEPEKKPLE